MPDQPMTALATDNVAGIGRTVYRYKYKDGYGCCCHYERVYVRGDTEIIKYNERQVTRYRLAPDVVDLIAFCTKNPAPMLPYMNVLKPYGQYWFVTITPYGRDIEPNVPDKEKVMDDFKKLSDIVGVDSMGWRYDPIFID